MQHHLTSVTDKSNNTPMTEAWKDEQLRWLARLHEVRRREIDSSVEFEESPEPATSQVALLKIFTDALGKQITTEGAANKLSDWVLSISDVDICYDIQNAYSNMLGVLFSGARRLNSTHHLKTLADITNRLSNLPDAYNNKDHALKFDGGSVVVQPGERISLPCQTGGELWSSLPDFAQSISQHVGGGPPNFFNDFKSTSANELEKYRYAEDAYTNINKFAALIAQQHPPQGSPLCSCLHSAFAVFSFLEHGPETQRGKFAHLVIRAAATWLGLVGQNIVDLRAPSTSHDYISGSLWEAEGGTNVVDVKRLRFWRLRFQQLRDSGRLISQEAVDAANSALSTLDVLLAKNERTK